MLPAVPGLALAANALVKGNKMKHQLNKDEKQNDDIIETNNLINLGKAGLIVNINPICVYLVIKYI